MKRAASGLSVADHNMLDLHLHAPSEMQYGGFINKAPTAYAHAYCMR